MLTQARLKEVLHYDPDTGQWKWLIPWRSRKDVHKPSRYTRYAIDGRNYLAHRLAVFYMTGEWPVMTDHRNLDKQDNRWENLRPATKSTNMANVVGRNKSGVKGVYPHGRRWRAMICGRTIGSFSAMEEAAAAYAREAVARFGEYART